MKRVFCLFFILILILVPLISNAAEESGTYKGINWGIDKQGILKLEGGETIPVRGPWLTYANQIKSIEIGDRISTINESAFTDLKNLKSISFGKDVKTIETNAFYNCKNLKTIIFLGDKTSLCGKSFSSCSISEVILPENSNYTIIDNCILSKDRTKLVYCFGGKNLKIPYGVTEIQEGAFWYNKTTTTINIPNTVTRLDSDAISQCNKLENIVITASVEVLGNKAFFYCHNLRSLVFLGDHITLDGSRVFGFCGKLQSVVLPAATFQTEKNVAKRTSAAFEYCSNLQTFVFSEGTKEIPSGFFIMCKKLKNVYIPTSIKAIDETAFSRDSKNLVIRCIEGSYAETFAIKNGFKYEYYIPVESITLSEIELTLKKGKKASLKQTIEPANITVKDVMWFSTDDDVATVNKGQIKTIGVGECDIICQAMDGSGVRAICHVIVE